VRAEVVADGEVAAATQLLAENATTIITAIKNFDVFVIDT
jgi:hypothetical protein